PPHRELRGRHAAARRGEDDRRGADRVDHRFELPRLGLDRRPRLELTGGEAAADAIEADDAVRPGDLFVEDALARVGPLLLQGADPARAEDDRRPLAERRVRKPVPLEVQVADLLVHVGTRYWPGRA